jgi:8-oxo-dGTP pyrophosphatase MutT (NUDIX family)
MKVTLDRVRRALEGPASRLPVHEDTRFAAIAAVLRQGEDDLELLVIRRAERPSDPWSGHMALPGGRAEPEDGSLSRTAVRETREEVGLDLDECGELLGELDDIVPGGSRGLMTNLLVRPFVWWARGAVELVPSGIEVDEIHWVPLGALLSGAHDDTYPFTWRGEPIVLPAYRLNASEPRWVWGMTHRVLERFLLRLRA